MEKGNTRALLVGMQKGAATLENTMEFPQKIKKKIKKSKQNKKNNWPTIQQFHCRGIYPKNTKLLIQRDTLTPMFIAALYKIATVNK